MDLYLAKCFYKTGNISIEEYLDILEEEITEENPHEKIAILEHENELLAEELNNLEFEVRSYVRDIEYLECELHDYKEKYSGALGFINKLKVQISNYDE